MNILNAATILPADIVQAIFQGELNDQTMNRLKERVQPVGTNAQWGVDACYKACGIENRAVRGVATFDDGAKLWDGKSGTRDGYFDVKTGVTKPVA